MQSANYDSPLTVQGNSNGEAIPVTTVPPTGASATEIQGTTADGAAVATKPVLMAGQDGTNVQSVLTDTSGRQVVVGAAADGAALAGNPVLIAGTDGTNAQTIAVDASGRQFVAGGAGEGSAVSGNPVRGGGTYYTNASQPAISNGQLASLQTDAAGNLRTAPQRPTAADIVTGYLQHTATTGAATLLTVAAGRTWVGTVTVSVAGSKAAANTGNGLVSALIATAGTGVAPAAATVLAVSARVGANAATGTVGTQGANFGSMRMTIVAPAGNAVTLTLASTLTNISEGAVDASAFGVQQ